MSIEVLDGGYPASFWAEAHGDSVVQAGILHGAVDWSLHHHRWGVVFEFTFRDEDAWERFRADIGVAAALDAVPDRGGLLIYRGRGGNASPREPRRPRPLTGTGAAALPLPLDDLVFDVAPRPLLACRC